jgi:hypothetical protein
MDDFPISFSSITPGGEGGAQYPRKEFLIIGKG